MKFRHILVSSLIATSAVSLFGGSETDRKIEDAAKASYNYRTLLDNKVTVKANEGIVTLTGMVADKDLKTIAEDTVSNMPGVTKVENKITLDPALEEHSDAWIAWKIRLQLLVRANVSNRDTKVEVNEGIVTLTGSASSAAEKELVGTYAKEIDGVKSVKNGIIVSTTPSTAKIMADSIDDASITSQVKYTLLSHKGTSALKTKVETTDGVVVLTGIASNEAEKTLAGKLAQSIRGVESVSNKMTVKK